jgi:uncharacterized membrane protein
MEQYKLNWIRRHLDPDSMAKYQHMQEKKRERSSELRKDMIRHLSTLNDGVIAIFITVMMLGILIPPASGLILTFFGLFWYSWSVFLLLRASGMTTRWFSTPCGRRIILLSLPTFSSSLCWP